MEGKGFFTKEIEEALLAGEIDLAVHSYKDLSSESPQGLTIAGISERAHPADVLIIREEKFTPNEWPAIPQGATVGTSSVRRQSQMRWLRPDVEIAPVRGNVPTRLQKLRDGKFDALIMARAGIDRIKVNTQGLILHTFDPHQFIPAPAQGVLAYQVRENDAATLQAVTAIRSSMAAKVNAVERNALRLLEGGCQVPLGIFAEEEGGQMRVWCSYAASGGSAPYRQYHAAHNPAALPALIQKSLREPLDNRVFITRYQDDNSPFTKTLTARGCTVIGESLLDITYLVPAQWPDGATIFFTSSHGVKAVARLNIDMERYRLFALGAGTAATMRHHGWTVEAHANGDAAEAAKMISKSAKAPILFPVGTHSKRKVQAMLPTTVAMEDVVVYDNRPKPTSLPDCDVIAFTSSLNVKAFLARPPKNRPKAMVAIGASTAETLLQAGIEKETITIAYSPTEQALADTVAGVLAAQLVSDS